jgi:hypothetical protein
MVDTPKKDSADYAANGLQIRLIGALAAVGALILVSQIALQWLLAGQQRLRMSSTSPASSAR